MGAYFIPFTTGDDWKQEALGQMWGIVQQQITYIVGADERTKRLPLNGNLNQQLLPTHEQIIRNAPEQYQDAIARVE